MDDGGHGVGDGENTGLASEIRLCCGDGCVDRDERRESQVLEWREEGGVRGADDAQTEALQDARHDERALATGPELGAPAASDELCRRAGRGQDVEEVPLSGAVTGVFRQVGAEDDQAALPQGRMVGESDVGRCARRLIEVGALRGVYAGYEHVNWAVDRPQPGGGMRPRQ